MSADLHIHSNLSDGTNSPEEVVDLAKIAGLTKIALTDHDTVMGIKRAQKAGIGIGVDVIPGIEFTTEANNTEVHILGYFFDPKNTKLLEILEKIQAGRVDRIHKIVKKLNELGVSITADDVFRFSNKGAPGRPHVARAMIEKGYVSSFKEAFNKYIDFRGPAYVSHYKLSPEEAIKLIRQINGAPVFAHPAVSNCDNYIPDLISAGLLGLEAFYSGHNSSQTEKYKNIAHKYNLVMTGGTDFHGDNSGREIKLGDISIPDDMVDKLKEAIS
ncbi:PHP domain-containing protein [Candidatus Saganbacteria bacterium]|nr:PHP domain-containing protein [Candidatus Saganbacteria bacterium]